MDDVARVARWIDHLAVVDSEIRSLAHMDNVFWQMQAILNSNADIPEKTIFLNWIGTTYVSTVSSGLRRLVDKRRGVVSLTRLLSDMAQHCRLLTLERYVALHEDFLQDDARDWFIELAGGEGEHVSKSRIVELADRLDRAFERVNEYTNTRVAHRSQQDPGVVTYGEARRALVEAYLVFHWCSRVLRSVVTDTPVPMIVNDWLSAFRVPWIPEGSAVPEYRHLDAVVAEIEQSAPV